MIEDYEGFIIDLDGTVYLEDEIISRADLVIGKLKEIRKRLIFISNKTTGSIQDYYDFLISKNFNIEQKEIITSTLVISKYLFENHRSKNFFAIGEDKFKSEIIKSGLNFSDNPKEIDIVIITLDRTLTYEKLEIAAKALDEGALFLAANIDNTCPVNSGEILDAGSTISALEKRTGRKLQKYFGKPSKLILDEALSRLRLNSDECLIIGDRLETDIAMGNIHGIDSALVQTGVGKNNHQKSKYKPDFLLNSIYDLIQ